MILSLGKAKDRFAKTDDEIHITLINITHICGNIMKNIKKERDQFLAIKKTYNQGHHQMAYSVGEILGFSVPSKFLFRQTKEIPRRSQFLQSRFQRI